MMTFASHTHAVPLAGLLILFAGSVLFVGRRDGIRCLSMLAWFPALLLTAAWSIVSAGLPVLPVVLVTGAIALLGQTALLVDRWPLQSTAFAGACIGYLTAAATGAVCLFAFRITGICSAATQDLWYAPATGFLPFHWLALGGIAIAGAGIIADLAIAVTATISEVHAANPSLSRRALVASGMRFGRDVIGTELNTLPLAVLGASLGGMLLLLLPADVTRWPYSWVLLANRQTTALELSVLASGMIGLTLTVPITAWLVARRLAGNAAPSSRQPEEMGAVSRYLPHALLLALAGLAMALCVWLNRSSYSYPREETGSTTRLVRGEVGSVDPQVSPWAPRGRGPASETVQTLRVRLNEGRDLLAENPLTGSPVHDRVPLPGERVVIRLQEAGTESYASLSEIQRDSRLVLLLLAVWIVVVAVARWHGWRAMMALAGSVGIIVVFLAAVARWKAPPVPTVLACSLLIAAVTYLLLCGWGRKTISASLGTLAGLAAGGIAAVVFGDWLQLSGRHDGDLLTLSLYSSGRTLDFPALLGAAALISALGVTMDVSIAVASAVAEVSRSDPSLGFSKLYAAGLDVGRKVMAAMFGALLFAFLGLNLGLFLLPWAKAGPAMEAFGAEPVAAEIFRLLVGGLALVWTVPATAGLSAWMSSPSGPGHTREGTRHA